MIRHGNLAFVLVGLALVGLVSGCERAPATRSTARHRIVLSLPPSLGVGEYPLSLTVASRDGRPVAGVDVWLHYYPFIHRVKDSLASPDEVVRVVKATPAGDRYRASVRFDRPGVWKIAVRLTSSGRPDETVYFTVDVQEGSPVASSREASGGGDDR